MQKLTRSGLALASTGLSLLGLGMAMGNLELLVLSAFPLLLLAVSFASRASGVPWGSRSLSTRAPRRGDLIEVEVRAKPGASVDIMEVHSPVPAGFGLDQGTNVLLATGDAIASARFQVRAHARGSHTFAPLRAEIIDPRGLLAPGAHDLSTEERVDVTPRAFHAQKLRRRVRGSRILLPDREEARVGVGSTDFRELRDYIWGDPPKSINWKATARRLSARGAMGGRGQAPLVNEYEKEGRSTAIILLDGGAHMRVGTSLETGLDHAVEAALAAARLFLTRGARVGAATFYAKSAPPAAPESGSGHVPSVERALAPGEPDPNATPARVLTSMQRHMAGARPVVLLVTRVTPRGLDDLIEMIAHLRVLAGERRRPSAVYVIDVRALDLAPTPSPAWETARRIVEAEDDAAARTLARSGARVVPWHPAREDIRTALLRRELL